MVDIGNHIIARRKLDVPGSSADVFVILGKAGVIPKRRSETYSRMARFRNVLVHMYGEVNNEKVHESISERLPDFKKFIADIAENIPDIKNKKHNKRR